MSDVVLQSSSHFVRMDTNTTEDSDASNGDVLSDLAKAWNFVKKWYNFRSSNSVKNNSTNVRFATYKSRTSINISEFQEPRSFTISYQDLPVRLSLKQVAHFVSPLDFPSS